jgi:preprotein translocase subunit SecA
VKDKEFDALTADLVVRVKKAYKVKESVEVPEALGALERYVVINAIDKHWQEHLTEMEELRRAIGLRSYGQKDPLVEYKGEAFKYFEELMVNVRMKVCTGLFRSASNLQSFENMLALLSKGARTEGPANAPGLGAPPQVRINTSVTSGGASQVSGPPRGRDIKLPMPNPVPVPAMPKVGRNDPCPCGSGKKFKQCHGQ